MASIRLAHADELAVIVDLRLAFLSEVRGPDFEMPDGFAASTREFFEQEAEASRLLTWLADVDDVTVGIVSMLLWPRPPQPEKSRTVEGYVLNMYVRPVSRRHGIAQLLMDACLASASEQGVRKHLLHFTDDARYLYESNGFTPKANWLERPVIP